jgi:hypothetical protein
VDTVPKAEIPGVSPVDVEAVGIGEVPLVSVLSSGEEEYGAPLWHRLPLDLRVARHAAGDVRRERLEAKQLLDGVRDQRQVLAENSPLLGVLSEHLG